MEIKDTFIRCIKKDERISVEVGEVGQLLERETTAMNTWFYIRFPETPFKAEIRGHLRQAEFEEHFQEIPKFNVEIQRLQKAVDDQQKAIQRSYSMAHTQEQMLTRLQEDLARVAQTKNDYERKWGIVVDCTPMGKTSKDLWVAKDRWIVQA